MGDISNRLNSCLDEVCGCTKVEKEVIAWNPPVQWVKERIEAAGMTVGSVHFKKRGDGELRKMSYRLHVTKPSTAKAPKGTVEKADEPVFEERCEICNQVKGKGCVTGPFIKVPVAQNYAQPVQTAKSEKSKKVVDAENNQMTVLDCNKVIVDKDGKKGRGAWRTIPLENVVRIRNRGITYTINHY